VEGGRSREFLLLSMLHLRAPTMAQIEHAGMGWHNTEEYNGCEGDEKWGWLAQKGSCE
jgi:hypothetical protein